MLKYVIQKLLFWYLDFFTISNKFLVQNISVASGYSEEFFKETLAGKHFSKDQKWKQQPI